MIPGGLIGFSALAAIYVFWVMKKKQDHRRGKHLRNKNLIKKKSEGLKIEK